MPRWSPPCARWFARASDAAVDATSQVRRVARALWGRPLQAIWQLGEPHADGRAVLMLDGAADPVLHVAKHAGPERDLALATAAQLARAPAAGPDAYPA